jgi:hypothetical protein
MTRYPTKMKTICTAILLVSGTATMALDLDLELRVTGTISGSPQWRDQSDQVINFTELSFASGLPKEPDTHRDSAANTVKLVNMRTGYASVEVTVPSGCKIGETNVDGQHVKVLVAGAPKSNSEIISFSEGVQYPVALRFDAAGRYGDKIGDVRCTPGKLRYNYM